MSTKIYNGYILSRISFMQLQKRVAETRARMKEGLEEECFKFLANIIADLADRIVLMGWPEGQELHEERTLLWEAFFRLQDEFDKDDEGVGSLLKCEAAFFPHKEGVLAMIFTRNPAFREVFEKTRGIKEFNYWNNTDAPEDVSEEEWTRRERIWHEVLPGAGIPAENGFLVNFVSSLPLFPRGREITSYLPAKERRAAKWADYIVIRRKLDELAAADGEASFSSYSTAVSWARSESKQVVEDEKKKLMDLLPDIDNEFIHRPIGELIKLYKKEQSE